MEEEAKEPHVPIKKTKKQVDFGQARVHKRAHLVKQLEGMGCIGSRAPKEGGADVLRQRAISSLSRMGELFDGISQPVQLKSNCQRANRWVGQLAKLQKDLALVVGKLEAGSVPRDIKEDFLGVLDGLNASAVLAAHAGVDIFARGKLRQDGTDPRSDFVNDYEVMATLVGSLKRAARHIRAVEGDISLTEAVWLENVPLVDPEGLGSLFLTQQFG